MTGTQAGRLVGIIEVQQGEEVVDNPVFDAEGIVASVFRAYDIHQRCRLPVRVLKRVGNGELVCICWFPQGEGG